jgi:hypothetical protein
MTTWSCEDQNKEGLDRECAKLDREEEQALADEGFVEESEWPEY